MNEDGTVLEAHVDDSAPRGVFEAEALNAVYEGVFSPRIENGKPVKTTGWYTIKFRMAK